MLIYDGGCGFCRRSLRWAYAAGGRFDAVPNAEVDPEPLGLTRPELEEALWWVGPHDELHRGHDAIAQVLETSRWVPVRVAGRLVGSPVVAPVARRTYAWVAANRSRLP